MAFKVDDYGKGMNAGLTKSSSLLNTLQEDGDTLFDDPYFTKFSDAIREDQQTEGLPVQKVLTALGNGIFKVGQEEIKSISAPFTGSTGAVFQHGTGLIQFEVSGDGEGLGSQAVALTTADYSNYLALILDILGIGFVESKADIKPSSSNSYDLGSSGLRWRTIYLVNSPNVSSDARLKRDIRDTQVGLDATDRLRPVSFKRYGSERTHLGLIAQEVIDVVPDVVSQDENGEYSIVYEELVPVLIKAIQELNAKVKTLEEKMV